MFFSDETSASLLADGFRIWNNKSKLHLIPLRLYGEIKVGEEVWSIDGRQGTVTYNDGKDCLITLDEDEDSIRLDDDTRGGLLAYGVFPVDVEKHPELILPPN